MSNEHVSPDFAQIVGGFMNLRALGPAPEAAVTEHQIPTTTAELGELLGSVYRDAYAAGRSDGWQAGLAQGSEDGERAAADEHHRQVVRYGELWGTAYRANEDIEAVIRQFDELTPIQITGTLRGIANRLQAQMIKGDK